MQENLRLLKPYIRGLPLILLAMIIAVVVAKKYLNYVTPMYESTAKLKLADSGVGVPNSNLFKDFDVFATANKISAEIEIMKSQTLLNQALDGLDFDMEIYRQGKLRTRELFDDSPILIDYFNIDRKGYDIMYSLEVDDTNTYAIVDPFDNKIHKAYFGDTLKLQFISICIKRNDKLFIKYPYLDLLDKYQFKIFSREKMIAHVKKTVDITSIDKDVPIIRISYKSPHPVKAAKFSNRLAEIYIEDYIRDKQKAARITANFLENRIDDALSKLTSVENSIQKYRDVEGITNLRQETETEMRKIAQLKISEINLKMTIYAIQELEAYMQDGKNNFLELAPNFEAFTDLLSTEIIKSIKALQAERHDLLLQYTADNGKVIVIDKKIEDLSSYLLESITNTRKNLETKYDKLVFEIEEAEKMFIGIPEKEKIITILNREFSIYQNSYNFLNKKKIEADIAEAARIAFHRIISRAQISKKPVSPNKAIIIIVMAMLAMFGTIVLIWIIHAIKAKVNDKNTIESASMIPIGMVTPMLSGEERIENYFLKEAVELEIKGLLPDKTTLCISSFQYRDGAVFNAKNLAFAFTQQGLKVLFIDVDEVLKAHSNSDTPTQHEMGFDVINLVDRKFLKYRQEDMAEYIDSFKDRYDIIIILNVEISKQKSLVLMSLATTNLVVLDARYTSAKKVAEVDLLVDEYKIPKPFFVLNRYMYNPNIFKEGIRYIRKCFARKRKLLSSS